MPTIPEPRDQWYVVQVLSGQEMKVRDSIERRIAAGYRDARAALTNPPKRAADIVQALAKTA